MAAFGMVMLAANILSGLKIMLNFGKKKYSAILNGIIIIIVNYKTWVGKFWLYGNADLNPKRENPLFLHWWITLRRTQNDRHFKNTVNSSTLVFEYKNAVLQFCNVRT